jgi:hypothetical protein
MVNNYQKIEWYHAKAFYKNRKKVKYIYIRVANTSFIKEELYDRIINSHGLDSNRRKSIVLQSSIYSNNINSHYSDFRFPLLKKRQSVDQLISDSIDIVITNNRDLIIKQKVLKEKEEREKREGEKQKLLDLISNGDVDVRIAISTYSPIKGMTLDQIQYMNEINEGLILRYDKFNRNTGTGLVYYFKQSSGFDYSDLRVVLYYFKNHKFMNVYRDLTTARKVHGKIEIH